MIRKRALGRRLRELREAAGLTLEVAAPRLDWSTSTLSRIETGQQAPHVHGVRSMLDLYGAGGPVWSELVAMAREVRQKGWWRAHGIGNDSYVAFENEASSVLDCNVDYVPGLLQVPAYRRALLAASITRRTRESVEAAVVVRAIRQQRLTSAEDPLEVVAVVDESVLHRRVVAGSDSRAVMRRQLERLLAVAEQPNVTVQVLPFAAGLPPVTAGSFSVLESRATGTADVVYLENKTRIFFLDTEAEVHRYDRAFDMVSEMALDPDESAAVVRRALADL